MISETGTLIGVDWGTSRLRAVLLRRDGTTLAEAESRDGIGTVSSGHEAAFERLVADWPKVPAILSGMVGSRQGWHEAPYVACPASTAALATRMFRFRSEGGRDMAIVPGVMLRDPLRDGDVIRGEESQIVGFLDGEPDFDGMIVLPGTHSKWATVRNATIVTFQTFLSGEMFELLSRHSFLRHSVSSGERDLVENPDFALGLRRTAVEGLPFLSAIFSVRVRQLLDNVDRADNLAYLSGLVIGAEIAAATASGRLANGVPVRIVGAPVLARAYAKAFSLVGHDAVAVDGGETAIAGLVHLARMVGMLPGRNAA